MDFRFGLNKKKFETNPKVINEILIDFINLFRFNIIFYISTEGNDFTAKKTNTFIFAILNSQLFIDFNLFKNRQHTVTDCNLKGSKVLAWAPIYQMS